MNEYYSINDVFNNILNEPKYETVTNEFCVWKDGERFIIEELDSAKEGWKIYYHNEIVRAIRLLNKYNLIYSKHYQMLAGNNFLRIDLSGFVWNNHMSPKHKVLRETVYQIQKLLFCKIKSEEIKEETLETTKVWIYPSEPINGLFIGIYRTATWVLEEIATFAESEKINIILSQDEMEFFFNPKVKEKLVWQDYLFNYHNGVCFITHESYSANGNRFRKKYKGYLIKVPEFPQHIEKERINEDCFYSVERYYVNFRNLEEWKSAVRTFIVEKEEKLNFLYLKNKDVIDESINQFHQTSSGWEPIDDNPYYRWDIEDDEQSIEFWDSI